MVFEKQQLGAVCMANFLHAQHPSQVRINLVIAHSKHELLAALNVNMDRDPALVQVHQLCGDLCSLVLMLLSALGCYLSR